MQGVVRVLPGAGIGSKSVGDVGGISMRERKREGRGLWCVVRDSEEGQQVTWRGKQQKRKALGWAMRQARRKEAWGAGAWACTQAGSLGGKQQAWQLGLAVGPAAGPAMAWAASLGQAGLKFGP